MVALIGGSMADTWGAGFSALCRHGRYSRDGSNSRYIERLPTGQGASGLKPARACSASSMPFRCLPCSSEGFVRANTRASLARFWQGTVVLQPDGVELHTGMYEGSWCPLQPLPALHKPVALQRALLHRRASGSNAQRASGDFEHEYMECFLRSRNCAY